MKFGILGAGFIAAVMADTLCRMAQQGETGAELYAVAARDIGRARAFAAEHNVPKAYGSYEEMLRDPAAEGVYIATPHSLHYRHIKLCADHGKHILCEKPFTVSARQAEDALRYAQARGVLVTAAIWPRYPPLRRIIREAVESGKYEIIIRTTKCYAVGDEVGICLEPDGIHVMLAEDHTTSFVTTINSDYTLDFNGKVIRCDLTKVVPKSKMTDNALIDENGETVDISKLKVQVSIQPDDIEMSDEAEAGLVSGEIINLIYKGDHYSYVERTEYGHDLIVDDEYLWNMNDKVSLVMPEDKMKFQLKK